MRWSSYFVASHEPGAAPPSAAIRAANFLLALLGLSFLFYFSFRHLAVTLRWKEVYSYRALFINGWLTTLWISILSLAISTLVGFLCALAQRGPFLPLRYLARIYVEVVRGTPLLVQILIFFYVVADAFGLRDRYVVGVLTLSFFSGAYISEILRAGIESVSRTQLDSAKAVGFTRAQTYRYVIFPQALRQSLPPLAGQFASLIKDSSLLSIISISEFTWSARAVNSFTFGTLESYLPLAAGYLILTLPISLWTRRLEERHRFET